MYFKCGKQPVRFCILISISLALILPFGINAHAADTDTKKVLILNSYHKGLSWTDGETDGILEELNSYKEDISVNVEYMDWKSYPAGENLAQLRSYLKYKYSEVKLELVVTTDDAALDFALKNRGEIFSNAPVVFCGVNESGAEKLTRGAYNVTGVIEEVDAEGTVREALKLYPNIKNIYIVYDNSESGISTGILAQKAVAEVAPEVKAIALNEETSSDILDRVSRLQEDSIILITTYYSDVEGTVTGFEKFTEKISRSSKVPVFHLYDFGIGHGSIGGSVLISKIQGQFAGRQAKRILSGEKISGIPVNTSKTTQYMFDYTQLKRFGIKPGQLPAGSLIVNKPFSFIETYKNLVISVAITIGLLIAFIFILLYYLRKISRIRQQLVDSNTKLSQLYEDLTASDEELKQQFDELETMQKSLIASDKRYAMLFEKMLNGFAVLEPMYNSQDKISDVRFISANPGFESHTNKSILKIEGKTWSEVFGYPNRNLDQYQRVLGTGEANHFETYYPDSNIYYLINAFKIDDNQFGIVFDNITNYKLAIKEVRKLNEGLEQRVADRTLELQSAVSHLEAFTYTVSHDLKSPLRAVDGYSRIVLEDYGHQLESDAVQMLNSIRTICREMIEMINLLLQYSATSRSVPDREEINTEDMFLTVFNEIKTIYPHRNMELIIETGLPHVKVDKILIRQVINNILSNAAKFTKDREFTYIKVGSTLTEKEYVFYVKDNGVGFDMKYSSKLFGIFQRLHTGDEFEGSGIGLVTIKKIIEKHGGKTWIEGEKGIGATVYFTLPFNG